MINHEEIKMLVKMEQDMEDRKQSFVVLEGHRIAVRPEEVKYFGFQLGQTINSTIHIALIQHRIDSYKRQLMEER